MSTQPRGRITPQEYLERERRTETKSEYYAGEIFAMEGASRKHGLIVTNLIIALGTQLRSRGRTCEVYPGSMRVKVESSGLYTYPDVAVVCGNVQLEDEHFDTLLNPTVLIEVLSPSTERYDRGGKAEHYRRLDTLQELLLIAQNEIHVQHYRRQDASRWLLSDFRGSADRVELGSIDCTLILADIYEQTEPLP
jgi:Uma2 family endonuclease